LENVVYFLALVVYLCVFPTTFCKFRNNNDYKLKWSKMQEIATLF
jgi:hypothetical protein